MAIFYTKYHLDSRVIRNVFPRIGDRLVSDVSVHDIMGMLAPIQRDKPPTARRVRQQISKVMEWAVVGGFRTDNPADERITSASRRNKHRTKHHLAVPHSEVASVLVAVRESDAQISVKLALEFLVLTAARSGEVRGAVWDEIDFKCSVWIVPAERMKTGEEHRVPLSPQAVALLRKARGLGDGKGLVFPSLNGRMLQDVTLSNLLPNLGARCVPHGMRSSFRDWCGETGVPREYAEPCLSHVLGDAVQRAYARSDYLEQRRPIMAAWAEYLAQTVSPSIPTPPRPVRRTQGRIPDSKRNSPRASRTFRTNKTDPQQGN